MTSFWIDGFFNTPGADESDLTDTGGVGGATFVPSDGGGQESGAEFTPSVPDFSRDERDTFDYVKEEIKRLYDLQEEGDAAWRIEEAARRWRADHGGTRWPTASELLSYPLLAQYMDVYTSGIWRVDPFFQLADNGQLYLVDQLEGLQPVRDLGLSPEELALFTTEGSGTGDMFEAAFLAKQPGMTPKTMATLRNVGTFPVRTVEQLLGQMGLGVRRGGGGGRGGGGRQRRAFDTDALRSDATMMWESILREAPDDAAIDALVDAYQNEAQAFWMSAGGSLDFQTFVMNRLKDQDRYGFLYDRKPPGMSEREYMAQFDNTASQFGLRASRARPRAEAAASQGVGTQSFAAGLARSLPVRRQGTGPFSQRFARTLASLGRLASS